MRKRILVINVGGLATGGITTHMQNYLSKIDKTSAEVDLVATKIEDEHSIAVFQQMGCKIIRMPNRMKNLVAYIRELKSLLKKTHYDVAHVHGSSCTIMLELFYLKRFRVGIRIAHSHNSTCTFKVIHHTLKPFMHRYYTHAFACSTLAGRWMFGNAPFEILHNVFSYQKFYYSEKVRMRKRTELGLTAEYVAFCVIGHLQIAKNQEFAIRLFASMHLEHSRLYIVGNGIDRDKLQALTDKLGLGNSVIFMGVRTDVNELLQAFDIYLMPSLWEGLPVALLEAQASGIPCVVSSRITNEARINTSTYFIDLQPMAKWHDAVNRILSEKTDRVLNANEAMISLHRDYDIDKEYQKLREAYQL